MSKTNVTIVFDSVYQILGLYISGVVLNASTQEPINNVTVNIYGLSVTYTTTTNVSGRFYISTSTVTPGTSYTITADVTSDDYQITTTIPTRVIDIPISTNRILINNLANSNIITNIELDNLSSGNITAHSKLDNLNGITFSNGNTVISNNLRVNGDLILNTGNVYNLSTEIKITDSMKIENDGSVTSLIVNQTDTNTANIIDLQDNGTSVFIVGKNGNIINNTINSLISSNVNINNELLSLKNSNVTIFNLLSQSSNTSGLIEGNITNSNLINGLITSNIVVFNKLTNLESSNLNLFTNINNLTNSNITLHSTLSNITNNIQQINNNNNATTITGNVTLNNLLNIGNNSVSIGASTGYLFDVNEGGFARFNNGVNSGTFMNWTEPSGISLFRFQNQNYMRMVTEPSSINTIEFNTSEIRDAMIVSQHDTAGIGRYMSFNVNNCGERMRINYLGNVGIGTTNPNCILDVAGDFNMRNGVIKINENLVLSNISLGNTINNSNLTSVGTLTGLTVSGTGITGTLNTASQENITSVGTLSGLSVAGTGITGTLNTPSQTNITSVGTLNGLAVSGSGIVGILATSNQPNVTSVGTLTGLSVTGTGITGTLNTPSQTNITSVGTLTSLLVNTGLNVTTNGNVGIGTTVPQGNLHVIGHTQLLSSSGLTGLYINHLGNVGVGTSTPNGNLHVIGHTQLLGRTGTTGLYVSTTGNVGIGSSTPTNVLDVTGGITTSALNRFFVSDPIVTGSSSTTNILTFPSSGVYLLLVSQAQGTSSSTLGLIDNLCHLYFCIVSNVSINVQLSPIYKPNTIYFDVTSSAQYTVNLVINSGSFTYSFYYQKLF